MNRIILLLLIILGLNLYSESRLNYIGILSTQENIFTDTTFKKIGEVSKDLSQELRDTAYMENRKGGFGYSLVNLLLPYGVGSYAQGDFNSGVAFTVSELILFPGGLIAWNIMNSSESLNEEDAIVHFSLFMAPYAILKLVSIIRPYIYSYQYNKRLKSSLNPEVLISPGLSLNGHLSLNILGEVRL